MVPNKSNWEQKKFKDLVKLDRGSSPRPIVDYITDSEDGVNWIKIGDTKDSNLFINSTKQKITKEGAKKSRKVSKGEIILSNSMSYGKPYILNIDGFIHDGWFVIRDYEDSFDKDYLLQYLGSEVIQNQYKRLAAGGVVSNISSDLVYSVRAVVPPLPEQQKIAKILSTWDKAISTTERLIKKSTQQKEALMQQLLMGKKRLLDESGKRFESELQDISLNDISELMTDYVANGSFQSLRENVSVSDGRDYSLYVRLTDLRVGLGHENQKYTNKKSYDFLKKSSLFGGELLMANIGANVGEVWQMPQVDMPATLAPNMLMTKFKKCAYSKFVYYFLSSSFGQNRVSRAIAGSGHPKINKTDLKQVKVLLPPLEEQQKIATVLSNADREIELLEQQLADFQQEKKALMQQLLTGKKRVVVV